LYLFRQLVVGRRVQLSLDVLHGCQLFTRGLVRLGNLGVRSSAFRWNEDQHRKHAAQTIVETDNHQVATMANGGQKKDTTRSCAQGSESSTKRNTS
jgi:hypothetical protein